MKLPILLLSTIATAIALEFDDQENLNAQVISQNIFENSRSDPLSFESKDNENSLQKRMVNETKYTAYILEHGSNLEIEDVLEFLPNNYDSDPSLSAYCREAKHVIQSKQDLFDLQAQCPTVKGTVHIIDYDSQEVNLGSIEKITGDLLIEDSPEIVRIIAPALKEVGGTFSLHSLTSLVLLDVGIMTKVKAIDWKVVPILNTVSLNDNIENLESIVISDTSLSEIEGFDKIYELEIFNINNNRFLEIIRTNLKQVKTQFTIHANAKEMQLEMPELEFAENITVRDTSSVYFPKLERVASSMEFIENLFTELEIPTLTAVGGTLGIIDNQNLKSVNFSGVTNIQGGLMISNNERLETLDFLPTLKQIGGAIFFEGRFQDTDFPELKLVKGSAYINSNSETLDCSKWTTPISGRSIIRGGKINCTSGRKQKSISVNENGDVIQGSEVVTETEVVPEKKNSYGSSVSNSSSMKTISQMSVLLWILVVGAVTITSNIAI
ncbi:hypothetical protein Kpol_2002p25 [Vanderwaltozyma polyspora DSM 70294]|uniref:Receptor L-domain domain-containing protein n=1 Tax=Vanderwaltozyma polyspora (strain ATCC 22028 / DSM 70294 / BCRC 21397 / CBS 2163 / NBRC 10782 / NRRL Y-8283 / UCD 57-17) TaxID=436907 RepID=A7TFE1_VANPO|nr:uncharacterized protein Kpol_2002p25 [Vanderwaltozyma polyspora DSM 70294]EDO18955.1 hypothetical protein Kpol_2002p25 [Vanderwaltozyma polyspora DSM 70294]